jgi:outer membrane protein TolC
VSDWTVSLGLQLPIFTGGRIGGDVAVARANVNQAELRLQQARELAEVDARNSMIQLEAAQAAWQASAGTVEQASRAYHIAELRYREGISTQTELLDSRIQLQQAQAARARAARDLQVSKVRMALLPALPILLPTGATAAIQSSTPAPLPPTPTYQPPVQQVTGADLSGQLQPGVSGQ